MSKTSIALAGLPASGKSSVGRHLAQLRGLPFVDLDEEIERTAGRIISEIFAAEGEAGFRARESEALGRLAREAAQSPLVLALGGGAVLAEGNRALLREHFDTVWLVLEPEEAARRSEDGDRPLLAGGERVERMRRLLAERESYYAAVADLVLDRAGLGARETAERIDGQIPRRP